MRMSHETRFGRRGQRMLPNGRGWLQVVQGGPDEALGSGRAISSGKLPLYVAGRLVGYALVGRAAYRPILDAAGGIIGYVACQQNTEIE